ncbi:MAG TPA: PIG-L family deacetylase [Thermoanaerobaculia bacterium]|nr:PIG-L family deacetylase [Thermoanaerobaculia bacterium]
MSRPTPLPGRAEAVRAESALVVAPHYDDEVLGCGGLLAQLVARGAAVRVLFLSDGSGGVEEVGDRPEYARRRRREAEAAEAVLGITGSEHLGLADGALEHHVAAVAAALRRELLATRPDLLLAPSPLEVSGDHRAAFAALHRLLAPLRPGDPLEPVARELTVLLYEVNHPGHPDLLVDVGGELAALERAMACYPSQQERHDYLGAALGLRRFRALSLPPGVAAAEGYRRLALADFTTRSPSQLLAHLGGNPDLTVTPAAVRISVVVRTCDRPDLLAEALGSLAAGTHPPLEVVLVNDGGAAPEAPSRLPFPVVRVDHPQRLGRAAAANAGVAAASGDWVAFLDDDDLAYPEHLATLAGMVRGAGVRVAYTDAAVVVYALGATGWEPVERRLPYSRDFDAELLLVDNYIPFNTLLIERSLLTEVGPFDPELPFFEDWDLLLRLAARVTFHHLPRVTCEYRHFRGGSHVLGERPRERPDFVAMKQRVIARHHESLTPEVLARVVDRLRAETVELGEEAAAARGRRRALEGEVAAAEERAHRLNGAVAALSHERQGLLAEHAALRREVARRDAELERLYGEERALRAAVDDQTDHIGRLYGEVERLQRVIEEMRATRAWRLHEWLARRRG